MGRRGRGGRWLAASFKDFQLLLLLESVGPFETVGMTKEVDEAILNGVLLADGATRQIESESNEVSQTHRIEKVVNMCKYMQASQIPL